MPSCDAIPRNLKDDSQIEATFTSDTHTYRGKQTVFFA